MLRIWGFAVLCGVAAAACPPKNFSSISNIDLDTYISKRWYIQQMMETSYLPKSQFWCVYAEYNRLAKKSFWGYDLHVHNHAEEKNGAIHDSDSKGGPPGGIDAKIIDAKTGKLDVAPSFLPTSLAGPYWVIDYDEAEGYSLISGGAPTLDGDNGLCRTGTGTNNAGLWIFTREQKRNEQLVQKVRGIAKSQGFDLGVLGDVDQSNCTHSIRINQDVMV